MKIKKEWFRYWWILLYFPVYMAIFIAEEKLITNYHIIGIALDKKIPFIEWFFFPYYIWFPYVGIVLVWLYFRDKKAFLKTISFLYLGMTVFLIVNVAYPNGLDLRPTEFVRDNIAVRLAKAMYETDTPTNVLPSIHVYNTLGIMLGACCSKKGIRRRFVKILVVLIGILIIASTVFVKQHSLVDVGAAIVLGAGAYFLFFRGRFAGFVDSLQTEDAEIGR